jgi:tRNA (mo5U34)-methyltransferase
VSGHATFDPTVSLDAPLAEQVESLKWYHSFDLPDGIRTRGFYDHRRMAQKVPIPRDLGGKRCLDVASADGFWAYQLAQRGAAEVVSVDLDDAGRQDWQGVAARTPDEIAGSGRARRAFDIVNRALDAGVKRHDLSVYDLSRDELGVFDFVFMGNVLLHLRDPHRALLAVRDVCAGEFLSFECISLPLSLMRPFTPCGQLWDADEPRWWTPNARAHRRWLEAAGFEVTAGKWPLLQPFGDLIARRPESVPSRPRDWVFWGLVRPFGVASQWLLTRPVR